MWWVIGVAIWLSIGAAMALAMRGIGGTSYANPWIAYPAIVLAGPIGPVLFYVGKV